MSHGITNLDSQVFFKNPAWHGLGTVVQEEMSPDEALKISNLNWKVAFPEKQIADFGSSQQIISKSRTLYRVPMNQNDPYVELGTHGLDYEPLQNEQLFELAYSLGANVKVESAGSLYEGRKIWLLLRGETFSVGKSDEVVKYMSLLNGHDGTLTLSALPTSVRIVCNNTLSMALQEGTKKMFKIRHTKKIKDQIEIMKNTLDKFTKTGKLFEENSKLLYEKKLKNKNDLLNLWTNIYDNVFGAPAADDNIGKERAKQVLLDWQTIFDIESQLLNQDADNYWMAANAVTNYLQKTEPMKKQFGWEERMLESNFIGQKADLSVRAFNTALEMV